jgi:hypothetical protein
MKKLFLTLFLILSLVVPAQAEMFGGLFPSRANITSGTITGITDLAVADGGTGASTLADGGIVVGNGTAAVEVVAPGATTTILVGGGAATNPVWTTATGSGAPVRAQGAILGDTTAVTIRSLIDEDVEAATDTLTANQCSGGLINNYGQANDAVLTLPAAAAGMNFTVILGTTVAKYFRLDPNASDGIILNGAAIDTDGHYVGIASAVQGAAIGFVAIQTGAAEWNWFASTISGVWVSE